MRNYGNLLLISAVKKSVQVEILLQGRPLISTQQLHDLVDMWLQTKPTSERIQTSVGSSAKDFVMVLSYGRSA
jgi:E3 ubiquitin-protein ligase DRIP